MLPHSIKRDSINKAVIADKCHNSLIFNPISRPAKCLNAGVGKFIFISRFRVFGISFRHPLINSSHLAIFAVFVIVIFIFLSDIIGRVANDHKNGGILLLLDPLGIFGSK